MIVSRKFTYEDFHMVRDFFVDSYPLFDIPVNWLIDRFNFTYAFSTAMRDKARRDWEESIHLWFRDDKLLALVNTEGEDNGEVFLQVTDFNLEQEILEDMFNFIEDNLLIEQEGFQVANLRISNQFRRGLDEARFRGYKELDWDEVTQVMKLNQVFDVILPKGFELKSGENFSPVEKGCVHSRAFEYTEDDFYVRRTPIGFAIMAELEDYRAELELYCVNDEGLPVAFCNVWFDESNKIAVLEPVGCDPDYRQKGLTKACVYEALNRVHALGAQNAFVGSNQQFYKKIGFREIARSNVMQIMV